MILALIVATAAGIKAQGRLVRIEDRFKVGMATGFNFAQIDGDDYQGYRKRGLNVGLQGIAVLSEKTFLSLEMQFSQLGARPSEKEIAKSSNTYIEIRLDYVEVPVMLHILGKPKAHGTYFASDLQIGFSYGRLVGVTIDNYASPRVNSRNPLLKLAARRPEFDDRQWSMVFGYQHSFGPNFGVQLRHTMAFNPFFRVKDPAQDDLATMRSYFLSLGAVYVLK